MTTAEILLRLDQIVKTGSGWTTRCPAHDDRDPSLSIATGADGRIILHCHAGCTPENVCAAIGITLADLFADEPRHNGHAKQIVATYPYYDSSGRLIFEVVRFNPKDFASAVIDYDYIMGLIAKFANQGPGKVKVSRDELVAIIRGHANFMGDSQDIIDYVDSLKEVKGVTDAAIREGYTRFKAEKDAAELATIAAKHRLATAALQSFVDSILDRMIFDGEQLSDLMAPLDLGWKARTQAELALMEELHPLLTKRAQGRDISGLSAYEQ